MRAFSISLILIILLGTSYIFPAFSVGSSQGSRPAFIYDRAGIISSANQTLLDAFLRQVDDTTSVEIVIYTIPSFIGHGIKKNGQEIQERDMLANYIFNELPLDGVTGIGKKGKDNGLLILFSLKPDLGGGSMRIEVGKGLEGNITDGTAGAILDSYLVPAKKTFDSTGDTKVFDQAFLDTVVALAQRAGYESNNTAFALTTTAPQNNNGEDTIDSMTILIFVIFFGGFIALALLRSRGRGRGGFYGGGFGGDGGFGGGGGGGGGGSGGGGAGR